MCLEENMWLKESDESQGSSGKSDESPAEPVRNCHAEAQRGGCGKSAVGKQMI